jgi:hypothetical protein
MFPRPRLKAGNDEEERKDTHNESQASTGRKWIVIYWQFQLAFANKVKLIVRRFVCRSGTPYWGVTGGKIADNFRAIN